jgi:hypothetical protein
VPAAAADNQTADHHHHPHHHHHQDLYHQHRINDNTTDRIIINHDDQRLMHLPDHDKLPVLLEFKAISSTCSMSAIKLAVHKSPAAAGAGYDTAVQGSSAAASASDSSSSSSPAKKRSCNNSAAPLIPNPKRARAVVSTSKSLALNR